MNYKVIGGDGNEYGPISADQVRAWLAEGRLTGQSKIQAEGNVNWHPLAIYPELTGDLAASLATPVATDPEPRPAEPAARTSGMAVTALVMGIVTMTLGWCCWIGFITGPLGIVFSIVSIGQVKRNPKLMRGKGMAITGLILSGVGLLLTTVLIVIFIANDGMEDFARALRNL